MIIGVWGIEFEKKVMLTSAPSKDISSNSTLNEVKFKCENPKEVSI